ncbi:MAG TPA: hypothetical protein VFM88_19970 [Vicinamibacteria bacterium]|nr:hypothetical protein [Vicinamibacteria bacterium]
MLRPRRVAALVLLVAPLGGATLSGSLPPGVPDGAALGWERVTGDVAASDEAAVYEFYVNPARAAIYEVVRYRFTGAGRAEVEKLIWNRYPSDGVGPLCYAHEADGSWRRLANGSPEYRGEMATAMRVYGLHRRARLGE